MEKEQLTPEQMDNAAGAAEEELLEMLRKWSPVATGVMAPDATEAVSHIADWWRRWYLLAGHKRLGRILMAVK